MTEPNVALDAYLYMHKAIAKDLKALEDAVNNLNVGLVKDIAAIGKWFEVCRARIAERYKNDDELAFTILLKNSPEFALEIPRLSEERELVEKLMNEIEALLARLQTVHDYKRKEALYQNLQTMVMIFRREYSTQLLFEEQIFIPAVTKYLTARELTTV